MDQEHDETREQEQPRISTLRRWYGTVAVVFLNTCVAVLVGLVLMAVVANTFERKRVYSSRFIPASYELSTLEEIRRIGQEYDQMGSQASYSYNPWTTFIERPFRGDLLNIEAVQSYPTRATIHRPPPATSATGREDLLVWTFGGSTMMGWGVSDQHTVASNLQHELQNALPDKRIRVVNHGHAHYFSPQEVALYIALLRKDPPPDIVVFLDGLNDVARIGVGIEEPFFAPQATAGWEAERRRRYHPSSASWFSLNANFPLYRVLRRLERKDVDHDTKEQTKHLERDEAVRRIVEVMRINRTVASSVSKALGIQAFFFLQPLSRHSRKQPIFTPAYAALHRSTRRHADFFDISAPLEQELDHPYVDVTHYSDKGSLVVAQRIARVILQSSSP